MAQELNPTNPANQTDSGALQSRVPQFVGGERDPSTGNIIPGSAKAPSVPAPASPTTQLGSIDVPKAPSTAALLGGAAAGVALPYVGAQIGSKVGAGAGIGDAATSALGDTAKSVGLGSAIGPSLASGAVSPGISGVLGSGTATGSGTIWSANAPVGTVASESGFNSGLGSSLGGAAGAGIGTAIATGISGALSGKQLKEYLPQAAEAGIGSAIGFAIGNAILPGIGGFAGSFIGGLFCHAAGTLILMEDGTRRPIEALRQGDRVLLGGAVTWVGAVPATFMFRYRGTLVNGRHAVFEHGQWIRVHESALAEPIEDDALIPVYPVNTERHLLVTPEYVCADYAEVDDAEPGIARRMQLLRGNVERNRLLNDVDFILGAQWTDAEIARFKARAVAA